MHRPSKADNINQSQKELTFSRLVNSIRQIPAKPDSTLNTADTLVEYALAGMDTALFVSRYKVELPKKEDMQRFIEETIKEVGDLKSCEK